MAHAVPSQPRPVSGSLHVMRAMLLGVLIGGTPLTARSAELVLTFAGTADLSPFGASSTSTFEGFFTWNPELACGPGGGGDGDFPLSSRDGEKPCVTAALEVNGIAHNDFSPEWSRLMLFPNAMALQLWWSGPLVDLDGGPAPDLKWVELDLSAAYDPEHPLFPDITELPTDRSFLRHLPSRSLTFRSDFCFGSDGECISATADSLVVRDPAMAALLLAGAAVARLVRRRA